MFRTSSDHAYRECWSSQVLLCIREREMLPSLLASVWCLVVLGSGDTGYCNYRSSNENPAKRLRTLLRDDPEVGWEANRG